MDIKDKINLLIEILNFKNLKNFADAVVDGNLDRAKGLSSGRIKNLYQHELEKLINDFNVNEKWLFGNDTNVIKCFELENRIKKINLYSLDNKIVFSYYVDITLFEINADFQNYFLIKSLEDLTNKTYFLCKKCFEFEFKKNMMIVTNNEDKISIRKISNISKNLVTLSEINNSSQKEKVTKDFLFDYVYAIVEKTISLNSLS